jgi:sugar lactone lactonase YvrE
MITMVAVASCTGSATAGSGGSGGPDGSGAQSLGGASGAAGIDGVGALAGAGAAGLGPDCSGDPQPAPASSDVVLALSGVTVSTLAGSSTMGAADGLGASAEFNNPANVTVDSQGRLFIADFDNGLIRSATASGMVTTLTVAEGFARPFGLTVDPNGSLYVGTDFDESGMNSGNDGGVLWRIDMTTGAPTPLATAAGRPRGLQSTNTDTLTVSDVGGHDLRRFDLETESFSPFAGQRGCPGFMDGQGSAARFNRPYGLARADDGSLIVADQLNHRIRLVAPDGAVTTIAGDGRPGLIDGPVASSRFNLPQAVAVDADGNVYISDVGNHRIRRISSQGLVETVAGDGVMGFMNGDGPVARFSGQEGLVVGADGVLYVADGTNGEVVPFHRVRKITLP